MNTQRALPTNPATRLCPHQGAQYFYRDSGHELILFGSAATGRQEAALREGEVELALLVEERLIVICCRVGEVIPWCHSAAYNWNHASHDRRGVPHECSDVEGSRDWLCVMLAEGPADRVYARRVIALCPSFTAALHGAIREQAHAPEAVSVSGEDEARFDGMFGRSWASLRKSGPYPQEAGGRAARDGESLA